MARRTIEKTPALALRVTPYSRTSHVVTWLTPHFGTVATVAKGARRPKSPFLGQCDFFYTCEILFYSRAQAGLHILRECAPLATRPGLRTDWRGAICASYMAELARRVCPAGHPQQALYSLLSSALDSLENTPVGPGILYWFELHVLSAIGLAPQLARCAACRKAPSAGATLFFSPAQGGIVCPDCRPPTGKNPLIPLDALAILRRWQATELPTRATNIRCTQNQLLVFRRLLGIFISYHLDMVPAGRKIVIDMLTKERRPL